jgi:hypothetical protein
MIEHNGVFTLAVQYSSRGGAPSTKCYCTRTEPPTAINAFVVMCLLRHDFLTQPVYGMCIVIAGICKIW